MRKKNKIIESLVSKTSSPNAAPKYKYAVNSVIIQHLSDPQSQRRSPKASPQPETVKFPTAIGESEADLQGEDRLLVGGLSDKRVENPASVSAEGKAGRRGMHSATGAYWNTEQDGIWNFKYEEAEAKGMDVVISVLWISMV